MNNTTLDDIAAVIGFSATIRIVAWAGGRNVHVPLKPDEGHYIARLIGLSALRRLSDEWGGELLAVPKLRQYEHETLRHKIRQLLEVGMPAREVARVLNVTKRRVEQVRKELVEDSLISLPQNAEHLADPSADDEEE